MEEGEGAEVGNLKDWFQSDVEIRGWKVAEWDVIDEYNSLKAVLVCTPRPSDFFFFFLHLFLRQEI